MFAITDWLIELLHISNPFFASIFTLAFWICIIMILIMVTMKILKKSVGIAIMLYIVYGGGMVALVSVVIDKIITFFNGLNLPIHI